MGNREGTEASEKQSQSKDNAFNRRHASFKPGGDTGDRNDAHTRSERGKASDAQRKQLTEQEEWKSGDPLPQAKEAEISANKFEQYSMNPENTNNNGKWKGFEKAGYDVNSESGRKIGAQDVIAQLREKLPDSSATLLEENIHGPRYAVETPIHCPNGKEATLISYWQIDKGSQKPRMITNWLKVHS